MRKLNFGDTFKIAALAKKAGVDKLADIYSRAMEAAKGKNEEEQKEILNEYGIELLSIFFEGYEHSQNELVSLMASVSGKTEEDILKLEIDELLLFFEKFFEMNDINKVKGFFTKAFSSMK